MSSCYDNKSEGSILESNLHTELSIWGEAERKEVSIQSLAEVMGAISEPLGEDSSSKLRCCSSARFLPSEDQEVV